MKPRFFKTSADFRKWLAANHDSTDELIVGFYRKDSGKPSITWPESVDQALCFGWIDGVRKSFGPDSYTIRFTPRKPRSIWSAVNVKRATQLIEDGLMQPAGLRAFERRDEAKTNQYSYERAHAELDAAQVKCFRANKKAWTFFQAQPPSYRRLTSWWVVSAKQEATREKRLAILIATSEAGKRV